jgi:hypothetical protein
MLANKLYKQSENFLILSYQLKIEESGNALSIITSYGFAEMMIAMNLISEENRHIVEIERITSLEESGTEISENDMVSFIEK